MWQVFVPSRTLVAKAIFAVLIMVSALPAQRLSESTGVNLFLNNCMSCHGSALAEHAPSESRDQADASRANL